MRDWKILLGAEEHHLTEAQLRELIARGEVRPATPVHTSALPGFTPLESLPDFWKKQLAYIEPEALVLADVGDRMKALAIDAVVFTLGFAVATRLLHWAGVTGFSDTWIFISPAIAFGLSWLSGTSPGKSWCGLRIVDARSGARPARWQFLLRALGMVPVVAFNILYLIPACTTRRRQSFHDLLARTVVVEIPDIPE